MLLLERVDKGVMGTMEVASSAITHSLKRQTEALPVRDEDKGHSL